MRILIILLSSFLLALIKSESISPNWFTCPERCQCYEDPEDRAHSIHLICKWEQLTNTNLQTLRRPDFVRTLTIRCPHGNKKVTRPSPGLFRGLRNLDRLEIDRCLLENIPADMFSGLSQLYSLIVKNAKITDLPNEVFDHVPNLMSLDLSGNQLRIEPYSLRALGNLIHLDLSNNSIGFVANAMASLTKLKVLTIDHNKLTNIDFRRIPEDVTDLSLRHNYISTIHYFSPSAKNLRRLDLSHNRLDFISGAGSVNVLPPNLKTLDLSHNRIAFVQDGALEKLYSLILLDIKNNSLSDLRETAIEGPNGLLRVFASENPFLCNCAMKWMLYKSEKVSVNILDLDNISCAHLINPEVTMPLRSAEKKNELLCKYENLCTDDCHCCRHEGCSCRTDCPVGCQCYKSARMDQTKTAQNVVMCENIRIDKLGEVPKEVTELRLSGAEMKAWTPDKLGRLERLHTLHVADASLNEILPKHIAPFPRLAVLNISGNGFTQLPLSLQGVNQIHAGNNPLNEFTTKDLLAMDKLVKISFGGNLTKFECSCESPSALQRWLRTRRNMQKVKDLDDVFCYLPLHGTVRIMETLPGNDSICNAETYETSKWITMVDNFDRKTTTNLVAEVSETSTLTLPVTSRKSTKWTVNYKIVLPTDFSSERTLELETNVYRRTSKITTRAPVVRRRGREEPPAHKFLNALIFILFVCVIILIVAIAFTLYFRFIRTDVFIGPQRKQTVEQQPLHRHA